MPERARHNKLPIPFIGERELLKNPNLYKNGLVLGQFQTESGEFLISALKFKGHHRAGYLNEALSRKTQDMEFDISNSIGERVGFVDGVLLETASSRIFFSNNMVNFTTPDPKNRSFIPIKPRAGHIVEGMIVCLLQQKTLNGWISSPQEEMFFPAERMYFNLKSNQEQLGLLVYENTDNRFVLTQRESGELMIPSS